jgi:hypothetical protein
MRNSVVGTIDIAVRNRFYDILLIKRQSCAQAMRTRASPLSQPFDGVPNLVVKGLTAAYEFSLNVFHQLPLPFLISIVDVPLVAIGNNTLLIGPGKDISVGFIVLECFIIFDENIPDFSFHFRYFSSFELTNQKHSFMEALFIGLVLCHFQKFFILLAHNFHPLADCTSDHITIAWHIYDFNRLNVGHFLCNVKLFSHFFLSLNFFHCYPIVRSITRGTSHDSCSKIHLYRSHGQSVNNGMGGKRCLERKTHKAAALKPSQNIHLFRFSGQILIGHVPCRSFTADENLVIFHLDRTVITTGQQETTSLAIEALWSQSGSHQVNLSSFKRRKSLVELKHF